MRAITTSVKPGAITVDRDRIIRMEKKTWIIIGILITAFAGLVVAFHRSASNNRIDLSNINIGEIIEPNDQNGQIGDHVLGNRDAEVVLVKYGNYQCGPCAVIYPRISALIDEYQDVIALVYRHFQLSGMANGLTASTVAETAGLQGEEAFWTMSSALFESQFSWSSSSINDRIPDILDIAAAAGIDRDRLKRDLEDDNKQERISQRIKFDMATAKEFNVRGTPSFFINGEEVSSDIWSDDNRLRDLIDSVLRQHGVEPPNRD